MLLKRAATLAAVLGLAACALVAAGSCGDASMPSSGGDAAFVDVRRDRPAPIDAGNDLFEVPDSSERIPDFVTGWTKLSWAPECEIYIPETEAAWKRIPPIAWVPCRSGRTGCQELPRTWADPKTAMVAPFSGERTRDGATRLAFSRVYAPYQYEYLVWEDRKGIVAAWRNNGPSCLEVAGNVFTGRVSFTVAVRETMTSVREYRQIIGEPAALLAKQAPDYRFKGEDVGYASSGVLQEVSASDDVVTHEYPLFSTITIRDRRTNAIDQLWTDAGRLTPIYQWQPIIGSTVFWSRGNQIDVWTPAAGRRVLIAPAAAWAHDVAADGTTLAWIESFDFDANGDFTRSVLYASPYTADPPRVAPRAIGEVGCHTELCGLRLGEGYAITTRRQTANPKSPGELVLFRLSDGAKWIIAPVRNATVAERFQDMAVIANGEIWRPFYDEKDYGLATLMRISIASLGAPVTD